jgi:hypothetical protein
MLIDSEGVISPHYYSVVGLCCRAVDWTQLDDSSTFSVGTSICMLIPSATGATCAAMVNGDAVEVTTGEVTR